MGKYIKVFGLGAGDIERLPLGIYRTLRKSSLPIFTRTLDHPVIETLEEEGVEFYGFDTYYEESDDFQTVYEKIVQKLLEEAKHQPVIYTVPGHPMLAEKTVQLLLAQDDVTVNIEGGQSYLDDLFTALKIDPIDGFQFVDATAFHRDELNYKQHLIFCQVYDRFIASEVKLVLLEDLDPEHDIFIMEAVGTKQEKIVKFLLKTWIVR